LIIFVIVAIKTNAKTIHITDTLSWKKPYTFYITEEYCYSYLYFEGAHLQAYKEVLMPHYTRKVDLVSEHVDVSVSLENEVWEKLSTEELNFIDKDSIKDVLHIETQIGYTQKKPFLQYKFLPFRKNGNTYEKLISYHIKIVPGDNKKNIKQKSRTYASRSVLTSGSFYKIAVSKTGIHKITYSDFESLGIDLTSLNINNISIFGNGGNVLPENTNHFTYDDLNEVPIQVVDKNNNGKFDTDDYVVFYAKGIISWELKDSQYQHKINIYSSNGYYFINVDPQVGEKKRVQPVTETNISKTHDIHSFYYYDVYEKDLINPDEVSRIWFSEAFDINLSQNYSFSIPDVLENKAIDLIFSVAAKSPSSYSQFRITVNNTSNYSINIPPNSPRYSGSITKSSYSFMPNSNTININMTYSKPTNNSKGYMDYIELHAICKLKMHSNQMSFRNIDVVGAGNVAEYTFDTKGNTVTIWDVTNPHDIRKIDGRKNGNNILFKLKADSLKELIAFHGSDFYAITPIGKIANQNLHGNTTADFVIITHPDFLTYANQLADFRKSNDNMTTLVVTTQQIYNEFSSGAQDISAIRNYLKMLYDRNTVNYPNNVLLFGKPSYDFRNITKTNSNFIPNYQGTEAFFATGCLSTDDFFVKLDDGEGERNYGSMDMGLGRLPVSTKNQAQIVVQKIINYGAQKSLATSSNEVSNFADWRNVITVSADDDADGDHIVNAENIAHVVHQNFPVINIEKIYLDAYKKISTSQGQRYPDANIAMNQRVNKGTLMFTYMGHGGNNGWAHERYLKLSDIHSWTNKYALPLFYAGSCSFGAYDKTSSISPSEEMLVKSDGGGIAIISATRDSYPTSNENFGKKLHYYAFQKVNNKHRTLGQVFSDSKNESGNVEMYVMIGDPSLTLAYPKAEITTDSINGVGISSFNDTIKALSFVTIKGRVVDNNNQILNDFNGYIYPTIYDKPSKTTTLLNNPRSVAKTFLLQKNILFKGKASVKNGKFEFSFIVPKDINFEYGFGKISYYGYDNQLDANGFDSLYIGGIKDTIIDDNEGPEIKLYLNNSNFVNGGISTPNPTLIAYIQDENGVNTVGTGIGHDIVAYLDGDMSKSFILNDFFEYDENSYTSGKVSYMLNDLSTGSHTLTVRAWDVLNNMGETSIDFNVVKDEKLTLSHVLNYPNPFTTHTEFYFEHNQPNVPMLVSIQIFTISGKLVKTIEYQSSSNSLRCGPIKWNALDDFGDKLSKGVYIYRLRVKTSDNKTAEKIEKLVII
ncbi:MAG: type IX secretion system sortase PorU, partial [Bacteroidales bacterium]|nr:type IX secretion system sortase PorU [Bacteroidales bacterium]